MSGNKLKDALKTVTADELQMAAAELNVSATPDETQIKRMRSTYPVYDELCKSIENSGVTDELVIRHMAGMEYILRTVITIAERRSSCSQGQELH